MDKNEVLVNITASRNKGEIMYKAECSSSLTNEEFEYYLGEIINGVYEWNQYLREKHQKLQGSHQSEEKMRNPATSFGRALPCPFIMLIFIFGLGSRILESRPSSGDES